MKTYPPCPSPGFPRRVPFLVLRRALVLAALVCTPPVLAMPGNPDFPNIPAEYLAQPDSIPDFWLTEVEAIERFLREQVKRGEVEIVGRTADGRPMRAVLYGSPRRGRGTTTFSGSLGFHDVRAYLGPDHEKTVFLGLGGVHGGEFEGIAGVVNLITVLETGRDLRGREWPGITAARDRVDRIILIPVVNVDGRARIPLRMEPFLGTDNRCHQIFNTGFWANGEPIGWPTVKEFIPLDFSRTMFPGGYPNGAGVNLQHDDFMGRPQPETRALFDLTARERPDMIINMHTGAPPKNYYMRMHRPFMEAKLSSVYDDLYRAVHTALMDAGLQGSRDPALEANPARVRPGQFNLDAALNLHCGALPVLIESPSHSFAGYSREGEAIRHTADQLVDAQLIAFEAALTFLADRGGRSRWAPQ
jgi:hypothetical protein